MFFLVKVKGLICLDERVFILSQFCLGSSGEGSGADLMWPRGRSPSGQDGQDRLSETNEIGLKKKKVKKIKKVIGVSKGSDLRKDLHA